MNALLRFLVSYRDWARRSGRNAVVGLSADQLDEIVGAMERAEAMCVRVDGLANIEVRHCRVDRSDHPKPDTRE